MKAISLWQPWASLIAVGAKRYETRGWQPPASLQGKQLAICAAKTKEGWQYVGTHVHPWCLLPGILSARGMTEDSLPYGAVVAVVTLVESILLPPLESEEPGDAERACGDWTDGRWAWSLADVIQLRNPVPIMGRQGVFDVPPDVLERMRAEKP